VSLDERAGQRAPGRGRQFTGSPGAGKSTLARAIERELFRAGCQTMLPMATSPSWAQQRPRLQRCGPARKRAQNRRSGASLLQQGSLVLCAFVSPFREDRERLRSMFPQGFVEVFVRCPIDSAAP
jgi:adenylylsulfate kinase-like enzyme